MADGQDQPPKRIRGKPEFDYTDCKTTADYQKKFVKPLSKRPTEKTRTASASSSEQAPTSSSSIPRSGSSSSLPDGDTVKVSKLTITKKIVKCLSPTQAASDPAVQVTSIPLDLSEDDSPPNTPEASIPPPEEVVIAIKDPVVEPAELTVHQSNSARIREQLISLNPDLDPATFEAVIAKYRAEERGEAHDQTSLVLEESNDPEDEEAFESLDSTTVTEDMTTPGDASSVQETPASTAASTQPSSTTASTTAGTATSSGAGSASSSGATSATATSTTTTTVFGGIPIMSSGSAPGSVPGMRPFVIKRKSMDSSVRDYGYDLELG